MLLFLNAELFLKAIDTAAGIHKLLLACEKRVTLGTDFNTDILLGGGGFNLFAAGAPNGGFIIVGMDSLLHRLHLIILITHQNRLSGQAPGTVYAEGQDPA